MAFCAMLMTAAILLSDADSFSVSLLRVLRSKVCLSYLTSLRRLNQGGKASHLDPLVVAMGKGRLAHRASLPLLSAQCQPRFNHARPVQMDHVFATSNDVRAGTRQECSSTRKIVRAVGGPASERVEHHSEMGA